MGWLHNHWTPKNEKKENKNKRKKMTELKTQGTKAGGI